MKPTKYATLRDLEQIKPWLLQGEARRIVAIEMALYVPGHWPLVSEGPMDPLDRRFDALIQLILFNFHIVCSIISGGGSIQQGFRITRFSVCLSEIAGMTEATTTRLQKVRKADFGSLHSPSESVRRKQK